MGEDSTPTDIQRTDSREKPVTMRVLGAASEELILQRSLSHAVLGRNGGQTADIGALRERALAAEALVRAKDETISELLRVLA